MNEINPVPINMGHTSLYWISIRDFCATMQLHEYYVISVENCAS